ncbi:gamma carbonic anhydrase family protein [Rhizobium sp. NZLR11]|uniref:gamma carbonic anhydrase family protein n=1 Tax=Rhizobium sp. NZLR11 TaxID=2731098 RepID=UPI001C829279|nr:gamma carbonic anhydrase family protein [Rhizobium sp. NZLR11]MBX5212146.1 gamma carbonic anhydrase family protein [Rhizobium sp. NZLR11]
MPTHAIGDLKPQFQDEATVWIAPDAVIVGDVDIGGDVTVWFGCAIRADIEKISIGSGTNIQEHTVIHADPSFPVEIASGCTIGHRALLHGCVIQENCLIGMGAIVLNGARIGKNSLVGAGALVTEGKVFPERSLILGSPATVVRGLTDEEIEKNRAAAAHYVKNGKRFRLAFR